MKQISLVFLAVILTGCSVQSTDSVGGGRVMGRVISTFSSRDLPNIEMVSITSGSFVMGCQDGREQEWSCDKYEVPAHNVNLRAFELGKYEVTQGQWKVVMGNNPSKYKDCGDTCPVMTVSWEDAQLFIRKLNAQTGKTYRLPSEAEWEYACRAGRGTKYCGSDDVDSVAWYQQNSDYKTHPVGSKQANAWGLYDMSGNVWEWVQDSWHDDFNGAPNDGSAWEEGNTKRMVRGGSRFDLRGNLRAPHRDGGDPSSQHDGLGGFRLARTLP